MRMDPTFWIAARATGLTAYALLTTSALAGLLLKARPFGTSLKPAAVTDLHRFLALLALLGTAAHGVALVLDRSVTVTAQALVVPGLIAYRPLWTGVGVVTAELALVIYLSFPLKKRIGTQNWRRLHFATYAVFAAATAHGLMAGSDSNRPWAIDLYVAAVGLVVGATVWRVLVPPGRSSRVARAATAAEA